jgi:hypothetical protein
LDDAEWRIQVGRQKRRGEPEGGGGTDRGSDSDEEEKEEGDEGRIKRGKG